MRSILEIHYSTGEKIVCENLTKGMGRVKNRPVFNLKMQ